MLTSPFHTSGLYLTTKSFSSALWMDSSSEKKMTDTLTSHNSKNTCNRHGPPPQKRAWQPWMLNFGRTRVWAEAFGTLKIIHFEFVFFPVDKVVASVLKGHPGASIGGTVCGKNMMGKNFQRCFVKVKTQPYGPLRTKKPTSNREMLSQSHLWCPLCDKRCPFNALKVDHSNNRLVYSLMRVNLLNKRIRISKPFKFL